MSSTKNNQSQSFTLQKMMLNGGLIPWQAYASKSGHCDRVIRLTKTSGQLTDSPHIRAGQLGF
jgi:hypothetical protein